MADAYEPVSERERCPTCGSPVRVVSGGEGTAHYEPEGERVDLIELRNLVGQAHATMALMWGSTDVRRAMASLQKAQTILTARLDAPAPVHREEGTEG